VEPQVLTGKSIPIAFDPHMIYVNNVMNLEFYTDLHQHANSPSLWKQASADNVSVV
jgi:hypothetical protein